MKNFLRDNLIRLARSRQYEVIPEWKIDNLPLVRHLRSIFKRFEIDCVFDVGGNLGQYHDLIRNDVGFQGWIFSFEPVSKYSEHLQKRAKLEANWRVFDFALGSSHSTAEINVTKSPGLNSFLKPREDVVQDYWNDQSITSVETVIIKPLDSIYDEIRKLGKFRSPYLKIDTQGFDLEVLRGANNALNEIRALQTEASVRPLYEGMPSYQDTIDFTSNLGFDLSGMFPVTHDDSLRLIEFDCVMVNRHFANSLDRR